MHNRANCLRLYLHLRHWTSCCFGLCSFCEQMANGLALAACSVWARLTGQDWWLFISKQLHKPLIIQRFILSDQIECVYVYDIKLYSPDAAAMCRLWKDTCEIHVFVASSLGFEFKAVWIRFQLRMRFYERLSCRFVSVVMFKAHTRVC